MSDVIDSALLRAEEKTKAIGERFTAPRRMVMKKLLEASKPLKAYDIIGIREENGSPAKPPTIYRALEFLCRTGLVHKIESDSSYFVCTHSDHCHYDTHVPMVMICDKCGSVSEVHLVAVEAMINETAQKTDFQITRTLIETHGTCANCRTAFA